MKHFRSTIILLTWIFIFLPAFSSAQISEPGGDPDDATLPAVIGLFRARTVNNGVLLSWTTFSEQLTDYFIIERGSDIFTLDSIGRVDAVNVSYTKKDYSFRDVHPVVSSHVYRLKLMDKDRQVTYSTVVRIQSNASQEVRVFPNPATHTLNVISGSGKARYHLRNMQGQSVRQGEWIGQTHQLDLSSFTSGQYILHIEQGENSHSLPLLIIR